MLFLEGVEVRDALLPQVGEEARHGRARGLGLGVAPGAEVLGVGPKQRVGRVPLHFPRGWARRRTARRSESSTRV
jgi:hypothetical protein